jgi:predicted  nucleic acid-binding Zn-ribbon protein
MLQSMQKKVMAEGAKEKDLYEKFMCYCKTSGNDLSTSIAAAEKKIGELGTDIPEAEAKKAALEEEVKQAQADRESAKKAMAEATSIREKEATAFSVSSTDLKTNIAAIKKAVAALEKGMAGSFLQTQGAQVLKRLVSNTDMMEEDRQEVMAFLSQGAGYAPAGGQVTGILKTMGDEMEASLKAETDAETKAIKEYEELMAAKKSRGCSPHKSN